jgi:hypothetical protein
MSSHIECDKPQEECGVFGVFGVQDAAAVISNGLFCLQHRGQEAAGIVVSDRSHMKIHKGEGLVRNVFNEDNIGHLPGDVGIGHVRYSTTGSSHAQNIQPLLVECIDGFWSIDKNGNSLSLPDITGIMGTMLLIFITSSNWSRWSTKSLLKGSELSRMYNFNPSDSRQVKWALEGFKLIISFSKSPFAHMRSVWKSPFICTLHPSIFWISKEPPPNEAANT